MIEEGRYSDTESLASWVARPGSIKFVSEDLGNPELLLVSSTNFDGKYIAIDMLFIYIA